mmetsp:Transcript_42520/g.129024  ORF Transcript_42520/g.129024 Transcript_42520/m.129024 type:complete len:161 (-) Transcript_42520:100-582(-)
MVLSRKHHNREPDGDPVSDAAADLWHDTSKSQAERTIERPFVSLSPLTPPSPSPAVGGVLLLSSILLFRAALFVLLADGGDWDRVSSDGGGAPAEMSRDGISWWWSENAPPPVMLSVREGGRQTKLSPPGSLAVTVPLTAVPAMVWLIVRWISIRLHLRN